MTLRWFLGLPTHRKVLLFLAGGMLTLVFDAFVAHFSWTRSNMKWNQWIPIVYGLIATVGIGALAFRQFARAAEDRILVLLGSTGLLVGGTGVVLHLVEFLEGLEGEEVLSLVIVGKTLSTAPPVFAPAAFAGIGLLLIVLKRITGAHAARAVDEPVAPLRSAAGSGR